MHVACSYTPSQNEIAERKHRHVTETGLTLMFHVCVPLPLWVKAFSTAVYLINRLPSQTLVGKTPYELLFGKYPDYIMLCTFGCLCFSYLQDYAPNKLSPKSAPCVFLGYSPLHKGFVVLTTRQNVFMSLTMSNFMKLFFLMQVMMFNKIIIPHPILLSLIF